MAVSLPENRPQRGLGLLATRVIDVLIVTLIFTVLT